MATTTGLAFAPKQKVDRDHNDPIARNQAWLLAALTAAAFSLFAVIINEDDLAIVITMYIVGISLLAFWTRNLIAKFAGKSALLNRILFGIVACVAMLPTIGFPDPDTGEVQLGVLLPLFLFDWRFMTSALRKRRLSLRIALLAALVALVTALFVDAREESILSAVAIAGVALTVQVLCPFDPQSANRYKGDGGWFSSLLDALTIGLKPRAERSNNDSHTSQIASDSAVLPVAESLQNSVSPFGRGFALLLSLIPIPGLHRIYVGRLASGLVWCITGGMFVVGQVLDFLKILFGRFRDGQNQVVRVWRISKSTAATEKSMDEVVNEYSTVPAAALKRDRQKLWLETIGNLMMILALGLGLFVSTHFSEAAQNGVFDDMGMFSGADFDQFFGMTKWPRLVEQLAFFLIVPISLSSLGFLFLSRLGNGYWHMLRLLIGGFGLAGGCAFVYSAFERISWSEVALHIRIGNIGPTIDSIINSSGRNFTEMMSGATAFMVTSIFLLSWPKRSRPTAELPEESGVKA